MDYLHLRYHRIADPADRAYRRNPLAERRVDPASTAGSDTLGKRPKYLIRDRDNKYGPLFSSLCRHSGIQELKTPVRAPRANAVCERFIGSLRRECLDYRFVLPSSQLRRVVREYGDYYNGSRPHQGIEQRIPAQYQQQVQPSASGKIIARPVRGGLHHAYSRTAYLH